MVYRSAGRPSVSPDLKRVGKSVTLHPFVIDGYLKLCDQARQSGQKPLSLSSYLERLAIIDLNLSLDETEKK